MKIGCTCDNIIVDQTDNLQYKGYIISDTQWNEFWDTIDAEMEKPNPTDRQVPLQLNLQNLFKTAWECVKYGRLYLDKNDGKLLEYFPQNKAYNAALDKEQ